jgi:glycosyltransferase involved in cell wall biosynthesis
MLIYGLYMVRNEADIIRPNVLYHLSLGLDRILVADNGSTDGTDEILQELSKRDSRVRWYRDHGSFLPSRIATGLAHQAFEEGAEWVVPIDADEFWHVREEDLRTLLGESGAGVLQAQVMNFIQRRSQKRSSLDALLHMTWRVEEPVGPPPHAQDLVEAKRISYIEKMYPQKCVSRASGELKIEIGNHRVYHPNGPKEDTDRLLCLHAPMRSRAALEERVRASERADEAGRRKGQGRNRRRWAAMDESGVEEEWAANSYHGYHLDVYGEQHPVIFDPLLRDLVAPFVERPL